VITSATQRSRSNRSLCIPSLSLSIELNTRVRGYCACVAYLGSIHEPHTPTAFIFFIKSHRSAVVLVLCGGHLTHQPGVDTECPWSLFVSNHQRLHPLLTLCARNLCVSCSPWPYS
jgi:hypothetical protein